VCALLFLPGGRKKRKEIKLLVSKSKGKQLTSSEGAEKKQQPLEKKRKETRRQTKELRKYSDPRKRNGFNSQRHISRFPSSSRPEADSIY
jgi:hypothetical protein